MYFLRIRRPPKSPLLPYTTLFRSVRELGVQEGLAPEPLDHHDFAADLPRFPGPHVLGSNPERDALADLLAAGLDGQDRKSTRLNSSHANISYAVFCLKKKKSPSLR